MKNFYFSLLVLLLSQGSLTAMAGESDDTDAQVYLVGTPSEWTAPSPANAQFYQGWMLAQNLPDVYVGEFEIPAGDLEFRFYKGLPGWGSYGSLGSAEPDFSYISVFFQDSYIKTPLCIDGMGNWRIENWNGGNIRFTIDLNEMTFQAHDITGASVELTTVEEGVDVYYDLNGVRVENPTKGLYITKGKKVIR